MRDLTAYSAFLPKPKASTGWSVGQTWRFCILACLGFWVGVVWILAGVVS